jgi:hypothetical protein
MGRAHPRYVIDVFGEAKTRGIPVLPRGAGFRLPPR